MFKCNSIFAWFSYLPFICLLSAEQARHSSSFWLSSSSIVPAYRTSSPLQLGSRSARTVSASLGEGKGKSPLPGAPSPLRAPHAGAAGGSGGQRGRRPDASPKPWAPTGDGLFCRQAPSRLASRGSRRAVWKGTFQTWLQGSVSAGIRIRRLLNLCHGTKAFPQNIFLSS